MDRERSGSQDRDHARCGCEPRATVEWYFGDLLDGVAREAPVTRARLLDALAALHRAALRHRSVLHERGTVAWSGETGTVHALPDPVWTVLADAGGVTATEERVARRVHRRMGVALAGEAGERDHFVFVSPAC